MARRIGYPLLVRPSYVLGGRGMAIVYDDGSLIQYLRAALSAGQGHPVLLDRYLEDAIELDVDALADGQRVVIGGIMQHVEAAGIHSGDSACVLPPYILTDDQLAQVRHYTVAMGLALKVVGLLNVQYAIHRGTLYVLEVNPRASRTVPFRQQGHRPAPGQDRRPGHGRADAATSWASTAEAPPRGVAVKEVVLPFVKFPGVDVLLGPEMKSTGEAMGQAETFGAAFAKASLGCGTALPLSGKRPDHGQRQRQGQHPAHRPPAWWPWDSASWPHRAPPPRSTRAGLAARDGLEGRAALAQRQRGHHGRAGRPHRQHALRGQLAQRRGDDAAAGRPPRRALLHHADRGLGGRRGHPRPAAGPAGTLGASGRLRRRRPALPDTTSH